MSALAPHSAPIAPAPPAPRLLDQLRQAAGAHFGRPEPGERYAAWTCRFILFHGKRHPRELQQGDVSLAYLTKLMHRRYPDTPLFRKVLQSIWHQVNNGREVFVVGRIQPDQTVTGGTGVAAEFAKLFNKPVYVFDQARDGWFRWAGDAWEATQDPVISEPHFSGTGTRFLEDNGRAAIDGLFARTFR